MITYHRRYWLKNKAHLTEMRYKWNKKHKKHLQRLAHLQYLKDKSKIQIRQKTHKYKLAKKRWYKSEYIAKKIRTWELKMNPCYDCKQWFNPWQMEFDHIVGHKKNNIGFMILNSWKSIFSEIQKCQLVCANCHRNRTFSRN